MDTQSDYVVVGTGSAGAVVASRLSTDPATTVVALEAGPRDKNRFIGVPAAFSKLFRSEIDWDYLTEPQPELDGREIYWPRGKVLGGSSSMNAMMWVRGFASDYDEWAARAGPRWSYADVLGYFRRIENVTAAWHFVSGDDSGVTGPLHISRQRSPRSVTAAWLAAARECGFAAARPNSPRPEGFCETVVTQRRGARFSTADAYLKPAMRRKNLRVLTGATATRVVIDGDRAVGVEYQSDGQTRIVYARREVVLCAGAVNSPQLLMLSGIGDRDHLAEHDIDTVYHAPEVGCNLLDHLVTVLGFDVEKDSLFAAEKPGQLISYLLRRRGMLTSNVGEAYGFVRSRPELKLPDLELIFAPAPFYDEALVPPAGHGVVFGPILVAPQSRGQITLRSADPHAKPVIEPRLPVRSRWRRPGRHDGGPADMRADRAGPPAQRSPWVHRATAQQHRAGRGHSRVGAGHLFAHPVPPDGHLPHGQRRGQRGGSAAAGPRCRRTPRRRRVGDAQHGSWAYACAVGADRGEGRRLNPQLSWSPPAQRRMNPMAV